MTNKDLTLTQDLSIQVNLLKFFLTKNSTYQGGYLTTSRMDYSGGPIWVTDSSYKNLKNGPNFSSLNLKLFSEIGDFITISGYKIGGIRVLGLKVTRTSMNEFQLELGGSIGDFEWNFTGPGAPNEHPQPNSLISVSYSLEDKSLNFYTSYC